MSLSGTAQLVQVNGAHFSVADSTKSLRSKNIVLSNINDGSPTITSLNGNVYTTSNINAGYYYGNASHLVSTTDAADGTYGGGGSSAAAITITNGRITAAESVSVASDLESVTAYGNTTTHKVSFNNADVSLQVAGNVEVLSGYVKAGYLVGDGSGISNLAQDLQTVTENGNTTTEVVDFQSGIAVTGDSSISFESSDIIIGSSFNNHNVNIGKEAGNSGQGYKAIAIGVSAGRVNQGNDTVSIGRYAGEYGQNNFSVAIGNNAGNAGQGSYSIAIGKDAGDTSQHDNTIILNATGSSLDSARSDALYMAPVADLDTTSNVLTYENSTKEVVKSLAQITSTGAITATSFTGDGGFLSNLSELTSSSGDGADGVFGSASKVPVITFDDNGRISAMSTTDVQSNVNAGTAGKLAFYTSSTQIESFDDLSKDGSNMTLEGTFTVEDIFVNGNLHVTGNTVVHDHVVIEDPILTVGNVNEATTQSVGTVFARSDANVALFYNKSSDGQAANKLTFGYTTSSGVGSDIIIDSTRILESEFYGNVVATANITAGDTITATSFAGSGAQLTNIDFSAVDNNAETRLAAAETDIDNLETSNTAIHSRMTTAETDIDNLETSNVAIHGRMTTAEDDIDNLETSNVAIHGRMATAETDIDNLETSNVAIHGRMSTAETDIDNLETSNVAIHSRMATAETDIDNLETSNVAIHGRMATAETDIDNLETKTTDISYSSSQTTVAGDLIVGAAGTFFVDQSTGKVGISNAAAAHELTVGANFYVDAPNDVVSTVGSTLNTGTVEVVGDSSTVDFKTGTGEDADCRIAKSSDGLAISTGGDGSLATSLTLYSNTDARFESNIVIGGAATVDSLIFGTGASIQTAQLSLDDVIAVSNTTTGDIIMSSGKLGIGTSAPDDNLHVIGNIKSSGRVDSQSITVSSHTGNAHFFVGETSSGVEDPHFGIWDGTYNQIKGFSNGNFQAMGKMVVGKGFGTNLSTHKELEVEGTIKATNLNLATLPTSSTGLSSGDVWRDGTTLKIVL